MVWRVVEKMDKYSFELARVPSGKWFAQFDEHGDNNGDRIGSDWAVTAPLAICRAALKAVME